MYVYIRSSQIFQSDFYDVEFGNSEFISYILFERDIDHSKGYSELFSDVGAGDSLLPRQKVKFLKYIRSDFGVFIHFWEDKLQRKVLMMVKLCIDWVDTSNREKGVILGINFLDNKIYC